MKRILKSKKVKVVGSAVFVVLALTIILFFVGVRVGSFGIGVVGSVTIESETPLATVVDNRLVRSRYADGVVTISNLTPETHEIILAPEDGSAWPWGRTLTIQSGSKTILDPVFVPKEPVTTVVTTKDPLYYKIPTLVAQNTSRIEGDSGIVHIDNGSVVRTSGDTTTTLFSGALSNVRGIVPFKNRTDTIFIAVADGVYALDISGQMPQNFTPLYRGVSPRIASGDDRTIYVLDGTYRISITY